MRKFRMSVAAVVAVAMLSVGAVACTPADQAEFSTNLGNIINAIYAVLILSITCGARGPGPQPDCG